MANRVILGAFDDTYVLRISRPGYDVTDADLPREQLSFDSRWQEAGAVLMKGTFTTAGTGGATISFGVTLPARPIVYAMVKLVVGSTTYNRFPAMNQEWPWITVSTTQVQFSSPNLPSVYVGEYIVYRNLYG